MSLIKTIGVGLSADATAFVRDMNASASAMDRAAEASERLKAAQGGTAAAGSAGSGTGAGGGKGGGKGGASDLMAPLAQIGGTVTRQLNAIGGTVVTLARRIDASMKFSLMEAGLARVQARLRGDVAGAANTATAALGRTGQATTAMGRTADRAITGYLKFQKLSGWWQNLGDVAGKGLNQVAAGGGLIGREFRTIAPAVGRATVAVKGLGVQIGLALGVFGLVFKGTQALASFFTSGIKGAIDLHETMEKTKEVFGGSTDAVVAQADQMAKAFGLPKGKLLDAAASIGLIAQGAGKSEAASAAMANELARMALDAESFYNVPLETSLEKIRSGLVGEAEPLRAFGVLLSETAVKAEAQRLGLTRGSKALDESAKVTARTSLITRGLMTASGDLVRTQDSAANQFRKSEGGLANFATSIGTVLLPAVQSGIGAFNDLLAATVQAFEENGPTVDSWAGRIKAAVDFAGSVVRNFGDYWELAQLSATQQIGNILAYIDTIPGNLALIGNYIANNWRQLIADAFSAVGSYAQNMATNYANLFTAIQGMFAGKGWEFEWTPLLKGFEATAAQLPKLLAPNLVDMSDQMGAVLGRINGRDAKAEQDKLAAGTAAKRAKAGPLAAAEKGDKYKGTAAAELGSKEAASSIARFRNGGDDDKPAKETAVAVKDVAVEARKQTKTLEQILAATGTKLSAYTL